MKRKLYKNKWFILVSVMAVFIILTQAKVVLADTDVQLDKILKAGLDGLTAYFDWLLDVLKLVW